MRALGLDYQARKLGEWDAPEPRLAFDDDVLFEIHEVGICGTDRELARFRLGYPPAGETRMTPGHEALGRVVATGPAVERLRPGDWVTPTVRRACQPPCDSCRRGRRDLCLTRGYTERGIFGAHGYFCELAVDRESDLVAVPESLRSRAILLEPLSACEKAVETALRLHQGEPRRALVLGAGPVGMLTALAFQLRGLEVSVYSRESRTHARARLLESAGIRYLERLEDVKADVAVEATGSGTTAFAALRVLAPLGGLVILGASAGSGEIRFREMILDNLTVAGSVNASPASFAAAVSDLARFDQGVLDAMIRRHAFDEFERTIGAAESGEAAKLVHSVADSLH